MTESNEAVNRRLYADVMAKGAIELTDALFDPDFVDRMPSMETPDREGLLKSADAARRVFPDVEPRIIAEIGDREWVAIGVEVDAGKHQGEHMGVPATGRRVTWTECRFWRVADGEILEHHGNVSMFEIHKMIGAHDLSSTFA